MPKKSGKAVYLKKNKLKGVDTKFTKWLDKFNKEYEIALKELAQR